MLRGAGAKRSTILLLVICFSFMATFVPNGVDGFIVSKQQQPRRHQQRQRETTTPSSTTTAAVSWMRQHMTAPAIIKDKTPVAVVPRTTSQLSTPTTTTTETPNTTTTNSTWLNVAFMLVLLSQVVLSSPLVAHAAPPIAIIAEELGYFPVQNNKGDVVYVPKRVQRESTEQAVALSKTLREEGVIMAGTYWCPHTSRQKELFGRQAWSNIAYVECAPKGFNANPAFCVANKVDGYPTWIFTKSPGKQTTTLPGERPLSELAKQVGMTSNFDEALETNLPPLLGSQACN